MNFPSSSICLTNAQKRQPTKFSINSPILSSFVLACALTLWTALPTKALAAPSQTPPSVINNEALPGPINKDGNNPENQSASPRSIGIIGVDIAADDDQIRSLGLKAQDVSNYLSQAENAFQISFATHPKLKNPSIVALIVRVSAIAGQDPSLCKKNYKDCTLMEISVQSEGDVEKPSLSNFSQKILELDEIKIKNFNSKAQVNFIVYFTLSPAIYEGVQREIENEENKNEGPQSCPNPNSPSKKMII